MQALLRAEFPREDGVHDRVGDAALLCRAVRRDQVYDDVLHEPSVAAAGMSRVPTEIELGPRT